MESLKEKLPIIIVNIIAIAIYLVVLYKMKFVYYIFHTKKEN